MIEQINIAGRQSSSTISRRKASESDYECTFELDVDSGLYFGFIHSNYNINSPKHLVVNQLVRFDRSNPCDSLRCIIKEIDTVFNNRGYISRCLVLIYKTPDSIIVAKAGGGIYLYGVFPPLFSSDEFPVGVHAILERRWEAERDFFIGSGGVLPLVEVLDSDSKVALITNPMKTNIEASFSGAIEDIISSNLNGVVSKHSVHSFCNDIFEFVYMSKTSSHSSAYLAFI